MKILPLILLLLAFPATAAKLDDSLSPRQIVDMEADWAHKYRIEDLDEDQLNALVSRYGNYEVRLNTAAHIGQRVRVYLGLPINIRGLDDPAALRLSWTTRGSFLDGTAIPGTRALLFEGDINSAVLVDILDFTLDLDSRAFSAPINFEPEYEIEIVTP